MDSLSQIALGSAVSIAVMGRKTSPWKAALVGAICGTLPDLDVFIDRGDAIRNMTMHRTESHALFYLTLVTPIIAWIVAKLSKERQLYSRWVVAVWLALITHPLLDVMTVYGTQLGLPFTDYPFGVGSIFIIDPLYTLPLIVGVCVAVFTTRAKRLQWNIAGLALSTAYLAWSFVAQQHVKDIAKESLARDGVTVERMLVTPLPFNTIGWRIVVINQHQYGEGFYSLLDQERVVPFNWFNNGDTIYQAVRDNKNIERIAWFSHGFFKIQSNSSIVTISDLRMGQDPYYTFTFAVAEQLNGTLVPIKPRSVALRPNVSESLKAVWDRSRAKR